MGGNEAQGRLPASVQLAWWETMQFRGCFFALGWLLIGASLCCVVFCIIAFHEAGTRENKRAMIQRLARTNQGSFEVNGQTWTAASAAAAFDTLRADVLEMLLTANILLAVSLGLFFGGIAITLVGVALRPRTVIAASESGRAEAARMTDVDAAWMRRSLELAERGRGSVEPNPLVGAVVVRDGQVVGAGWHQRFGGPHAEVHALAAAGEAAHGSTLYVTLEPCCHHGKTPPCTDAILRAGVARVVAAMPDPFPAVAGKGVEQLRQAGVVVDIGIEEAAARRLNAPYLTLLTHGRPYVHLKWAMTLDGKIATRTGSSKWISGPAARRLAHELRGRMDAIVVGIGTALADDPQLTARPPGPRTAARVVLDSQGRLPLDSLLVRTAREVPTLVAVSAALPPGRENDLRAAGCEVLRLPVEAESGRPQVQALLAEMGRRRWTNILVEGGSAIHGSFLDAGAVDEVHVFIAPRLAGGSAARTPVGGHGVEQIASALPLAEWTVTPVESDLYVHGYRH